MGRQPARSRASAAAGAGVAAPARSSRPRRAAAPSGQGYFALAEGGADLSDGSQSGGEADEAGEGAQGGEPWEGGRAARGAASGSDYGGEGDSDDAFQRVPAGRGDKRRQPARSAAPRPKRARRGGAGQAAGRANSSGKSSDSEPDTDEFLSDGGGYEDVAPPADVPAAVERLGALETLLSSRQTAAGETEFFVKLREKGYRHCYWAKEADVKAAGRYYEGIAHRVRAFLRRRNARSRSHAKSKDGDGGSDGDDGGASSRRGGEPLPFPAEWCEVERVIAEHSTPSGSDYLVLWRSLGYGDATWEESELLTRPGDADAIVAFRAVQARASSKRGAPPKRSERFDKFEVQPASVPEGLTLHPYQLTGVNWLRFAHHRGTNAVLADEMGLGKTIQSVTFLAALHEAGVRGPHLVVAPLSTLRNWERELQLWTPQLYYCLYTGNAEARSTAREFEWFNRKGEKRDTSNPKMDVLLTSYEVVMQDEALIRRLQFDTLIVDEGHRLKNADSKLYKVLDSLKLRRRYLLSGTPLQNNLDELFMLMHFVDSAKFNDLEAFNDRFADLRQDDQVKKLHELLKPHLLRRVKRDVLKELPPKKELIVRVELSAAQKGLYREMLTRNYEGLIARGAKGRGVNVLADLRLCCAHPDLCLHAAAALPSAHDEQRRLVSGSGKLHLLDRLLSRLHANGHRVLIYSQFTRVLDLLEDWLRGRAAAPTAAAPCADGSPAPHVYFERIDGTVAGTTRQASIDRFNKGASKVNTFLLSTRAGGLGINLATADTVIIYDSDFNPHNDLQAQARAHRMGQRNAVMIYRLVSRGTVEERIVQRAKGKMVLEHLVVRKMGADDAKIGGDTPQKGKGKGKSKEPAVLPSARRRADASKLDQAELDDILRYGAADLFADEGGAGKAAEGSGGAGAGGSGLTAGTGPDGSGAGSKAIVWDDEALERLLDRSQIVPDKEEESGEDDYLASFKVADFAMRDAAPEATETWGKGTEDAAKPKSTDDKASFWQGLLGDKHAQLLEAEQQRAALEEAGKGKGKRKRKVINYAEGLEKAEEDDGEGYSPDASDSEEDENDSDLEMLEMAVAAAPKRERMDRRAQLIMGVNKGERKRFLTAILRFGLPPSKSFDHLAESAGLSETLCNTYGHVFFSIVGRRLAPDPALDKPLGEEVAPAGETEHACRERINQLGRLETERKEKKRLEAALLTEVGLRKADVLLERIGNCMLLIGKLDNAFSGGADKFARGSKSLPDPLPALRLDIPSCHAVTSLRKMKAWNAVADMELLLGVHWHGWNEMEAVLADERLHHLRDVCRMETGCTEARGHEGSAAEGETRGGELPAAPTVAPDAGTEGGGASAGAADADAADAAGADAGAADAGAADAAEAGAADAGADKAGAADGADVSAQAQPAPPPDGAAADGSGAARKRMDEKQMTRACVEFLRRRLGHLAKGLLAEYEEQAAQRNAATLGARAKEERRVAAAAAAEARVLEAQADVQAAQAAQAAQVRAHAEAQRAMAAANAHAVMLAQQSHQTLPGQQMQQQMFQAQQVHQAHQPMGYIPAAEPGMQQHLQAQFHAQLERLQQIHGPMTSEQLQEHANRLANERISQLSRSL